MVGVPLCVGVGLSLLGRAWENFLGEGGGENVLYLKLGSGYIGGYTCKNAYDFTVSKLHFILKKKGYPPPFDDIAHWGYIASFDVTNHYNSPLYLF